MLVPLLVFVVSTVLFGAVGLVALPLLGVRSRRFGALVVFVLAAQSGALLFALAYGWLFADAAGQLRSTGSVIGLFLGMPVAGVALGAAAVRRFVARRARRR